MRANPIRQKLARGENVMGMMHFTASPMIVEVMASAGLDFFIIDFEHSPIDIGMAAHLVRLATRQELRRSCAFPKSMRGS